MATINKIPNCPPLRFPDFTDEWRVTTLGEVSERITRKNVGNTTQRVLTISAQYGLIDQRDFFNKTVASTNIEGYYLLNKGEFAYNRSSSTDYPWGAIKRLDNYNEGVLSTLYICFAILKEDTSFLAHFFETSQWHNYIQSISAEGARNHGLLNIAVSDFFALPLSLPSLAEQKKIADFLSLIDERIQSCSETIKELKTQKAGLLNQLFSQKLRFPDFTDEWTQTTLGEILDYEQPTFYIVNNTDYSNDSSLIPVLTANKSFVLGYVNEENIYDKGECIILDDFTLDIKFVDFPFKVKSSAIKILTAKKSVNIKTIYNYLLFMNLRGQEKDHKRHYISEIQPLSISLPSLEEQKKIADFLSLIDERIEVEEQLLKKYEEQKKYLLRHMFV